MCGICGKVSRDGRPVEPDIVAAMMDRLAHRGPDDQGVFADAGVALGHTRLSIIDLSTGQQPIANEDRTVWVVFNGEIYNFRELRHALISSGHVFRTNTDTEVIVHLYEEYGEACVAWLRGMFAFALWDARKRLLLLARDRVGIKPLYYCLTDGHLLFASEVKSLLADPSVRSDIEPAAIDTFLTFHYLPGRETPWRNILKLEPGRYLVMQDGRVRVHRYWDLAFDGSGSNGDLAETSARLEALLQQSVRDHMISDVPVGVLLSGGVDSSAMLSYAVQETNKPVATFTVGFDGEGIADERPYAALAAARYGCPHYAMTVRPQEFQAFLGRYVWHMEEPVCEPPAVALYYVTKLARQHVKVLLSGEGGDEGFAGYQNYRNLLWVERVKKLGPQVNAGLAGVLEGAGRILPFKRLQKYSAFLRTPLDRHYFSRTSGPFTSFNAMKALLYSERFSGSIDTDRAAASVAAHFEKVRNEHPLNQMLYVDTMTWLPDDLLVKADKMTMANSVELRVPLLDHRVLEFAARLPIRYKVNGFNTKFILKKTLESRVPREILERPKTGFPVPYASWFRNELKDFLWETLTDGAAIRRGYFRRGAIEQLLRENAAGRDWSAELFSLVTLELWHRTFVDQRGDRLAA